MCEWRRKDELLEGFAEAMRREEKSPATMEKYLRDVRRFFSFLGDRPVSKEETIAYKEALTGQYAPASVNSMLAALNYFLRFAGRSDCCVKQLRLQRQIFCREDRELTKEEYNRLVKAARRSGKQRLNMILQTICGTGIRVSELRYITVEAVRQGKAVVDCKNKMRIIFIPPCIRKLLIQYARKNGIRTGMLFVTRSGKPLDRRNIWREMKALCKEAGVSSQKVYPHSLRHLFARIFYTLEKDIVRLADLLGHGSVDTTRIYTRETGNEHLRRLIKVEKLLMMT